MSVLDECIAAAADPFVAGNRVELMREDAELRGRLDGLPAADLRRLVSIASFSNFLFHFLCRHPEVIDHVTRVPRGGAADVPNCADLDGLRLYKYRELFRITWADFGNGERYETVLEALSTLAEAVVAETIRLELREDERRMLEHSLCIFALGKLGARELNFSSDLDLLFVSDNHAQSGIDIAEFQKRLLDGLRRFTRVIEERTDAGFLYRVDLNLRPWGRSGPLFMAIDDTEHYYEASSDAWERFAWLRARPLAGAVELGMELLRRLQPFVFLRSLSTGDLQRFVEIKNEMSRTRKRRGHWDVKVGEGGIRDVEFFVQTLQVVNAAHHPALQTTGTLPVLDGLADAGLLAAAEAREVRRSYLFLRRIENRLQMIDEKQTHELPDAPGRRLVLARSLGFAGQSDAQRLDNFESELILNQSIARGLFDRILPAGADP